MRESRGESHFPATVSSTAQSLRWVGRSAASSSVPRMPRWARPPRWAALALSLTMLVGCITSAPAPEVDPRGEQAPSNALPAEGPQTAANADISGRTSSVASSSGSEFVDDASSARPTSAPPTTARATGSTSSGAASSSGAPASSASGGGAKLSADKAGADKPSGTQAAGDVNDSPIPSFGAGAELNRKEGKEVQGTPASTGAAEAVSSGEGTTAESPDSFGQGAEIYRAEPGEELPGPPRLRGRPGPLVPGSSGEPSAPQPPGTRADNLTLLVYQLQSEVYGLQWALRGRPLLPRLVLRIDGLSASAQELAATTRDNAGRSQQSAAVLQAVNALQEAAHQRNRVEVETQLWRLQDLLLRMRTP